MKDTDADADILKWKRKRMSSTIICVYYNFLFGLEYTAVVVSLLYYLREYFNPNSANLMYGIITAASLIPGFFAGKVGQIVDKSGNLKGWMCGILLVVTLGNLLYTIHSSVWFLIIGRFLTGFAICLRSCIAGEFSKWYENPKKVFFYYQIAFSAGFIIGPATATLFTGVDFTIGSWHLSQYNFIGMFMAGLSFLTFLATAFGVHNLSRDAPELSESCSGNEMPKGSISSMKDIIRNYDIVLLIATNSWIFFMSFCFELLISMIGLNTLGMNMKSLSMSIFISFAVFMVFMLAFWPRFFSGKDKALRGLIFCLFCGCYACVVLVIPSYVKITNGILKSFFIITASCLNAIFSVPALVAIRELLFLIVPKDSACFVDGVRTGIAVSAFSLLGFLLASPVYSTIELSVPLMCLVLLLLTVPLYKRKKVFLNH